MKKTRILALILCLVVCLSVVTGCNLITRNDKAYFESVVATITFADGTKDDIKKRELLMGYNSYGYNYEQNYGQTREQAIKTTLDSIIDQHLTIKAVKDYYAERNEDLFNGRETTYLWDTTFDAIYGNLQSYYQDVTGETPNTSNSSSNSSYGYAPYEKQVYLDEVQVENKFPKVKYDENGKILRDENGEVVYERDEDGNIVYVIQPDTKLVLRTYETASTIRDGNDAEYKERIVPKANGEVLDLESESGDSKEYMYQCFAKLFDGETKEARNWKSAFKKYLSAVKDNYTYIDFESDKDCFLFEINRVYEIMRDNYIVEKYSLIFNESAHQDANTATVSVGDILSYYASKVRTDFVTYKNDRSGFDSKILTDVANMDYIYNGEDQSNFFYVGYIKLQFDEEQQKAYDKASKIPETYNDYREAELKKVYDGVYASVRDKNGEKTGKVVYANQLLQEIQSKINKFSYIEKGSVQAQGLDDAELIAHNKRIEDLKAQEFRNYLYFYNDDSSLQNAEFNTVVGVNSKGEAILPSDLNDKGVDQKAILKLYQKGNAKVGDMTTLVKGNDGIYLFFYAGEIGNIFAVGDDFSLESNEDNIKVLASTKLNIFSNKTYLDKLYEELKADKFQTFQNMDIQRLRKEATKIEAKENNFKDLY